MAHPYYQPKTIILNPEEAQRLDYEHNWKDLVSFDTYLSIKAQQQAYDSNEKGYERTKSIQDRFY
jgi:hypothetical protein